MKLDALLAFVPLGAPLSFVGQGSGVAIAGSGVIDLLGQGVGQPPGNIIGNAATFGEDPGIGQVRVEIEAAVGAAFVGLTSLAVALQYAADTGVGGGYQPGTWFTVADQVTAVANLTAGAKVFRLPFLPAAPVNLRPRYVRMLFTPTGVATAGTIAWAIPTLGRDDQANKFAAKNFTVM